MGLELGVRFENISMFCVCVCVFCVCFASFMIVLLMLCELCLTAVL
jgi:hypothetical protein